MPPPAVLVNSLVFVQDEYHLDNISRTVIHILALLGVNRIPLLPKCYNQNTKNIAIICSFFVMFYFITNSFLASGGLLTDMSEYIAVTTLGFLTCKRLRLFFNDIANFDRLVNLRPRNKYVLRCTKLGLVITTHTILSIIYIFWTRSWRMRFDQWIIYIIRIIRLFEFYFYGHLVSLLHARMKLINHYIGLSLKDHDNENSHVMQRIEYDYEAISGPPHNVSDFSFLMDLYRVIIAGCDHLTNAILYQVLL